MKPRLVITLVPIFGFVLSACGAYGAVDPPIIEDPADAMVHDLPDVDIDDYRHLFDYDHEAPLDIQVRFTLPESGMEVQTFSYASPLGGRVPSTLIIPPGKGPFAGLILMHGMPGSRLDFKWLGERYARYGIVVLLIDAPFNRPENADRTWPRGVPLTLRAEDAEDQIQLIVDLMRGVDLLAARADVDPDRIGYLGLSFGGAMGGLLAGTEDRLKAAVLIVGDGGTVTHLIGNDDRDNYWGSPVMMLTEDRQMEWLDAMWPIEPIHYVQEAAPTALLFQNATHDTAVLPADAARYQLAGSEPKRILWYDSPHFPLPWHVYRDNLAWLGKYIGASPLNLVPNFRSTAVVLDGLLALWMLLAAGSLGYLAWNLRRRDLATPGALMYWILSTVFFGPLSLMVYFISTRSVSESSDRAPQISPPKRALAATIWASSANLVGVIIALELDLYELPIEQEYPLIILVTVLLFPILAGIFFTLIAKLISLRRPQFTQSYHRPPQAEIISATIFVVVTFPLLIMWARRYFGMGLSFTEPEFWGLLLPFILLGTAITYPLNLWMIRSGIVRWGPQEEGPEADAPRVSRVVVLLVAILFLLLAIAALIFFMMSYLDLPFETIWGLLLGRSPG